MIFCIPFGATFALFCWKFDRASMTSGGHMSQLPHCFIFWSYLSKWVAKLRVNEVSQRFNGNGWQKAVQRLIRGILRGNVGDDTPYWHHGRQGPPLEGLRSLILLVPNKGADRCVDVFHADISPDSCRNIVEYNAHPGELTCLIFFSVIMLLQSSIGSALQI